ncbi:MAG: DUF4340 domain-containing protein [Acidobacteria bacterium]|nr:DUF4340 domain-containing protein [Acidobacteriota bacterium]
MRGLRSTLVLLVVAIGLGAYIYFVERHRDPASTPEPNEQLFTFDADDVTELQIRAEDGAVTDLRQDEGVWRVVAPVETAADDVAATSVAASLATLDIDRVLEEGAVDLEPFGLDAPALDVSFAAGGDSQRLLIGDETPTGANRYAKLGASDRVFLIAGHHGTTFNKTTFDLRDKTILDFDRDTLDRLEVSSGEQTIEFTRDGDDWRLAMPLGAAADFATVEGLIGSLGSGRMRAVESENADALEEYGLEAPAHTVSMHAGSATATLQIGGETPDGNYFARDAARPLVFTVDASLVTSLERDASEYRRKALFAFRPFNARRLEIERGDGVVVFEKRAADEDDEEAEDIWELVAPETGSVPHAEMEDLLSKLSGLRAESFVASREEAGVGPEQVAATVRAQFGDDDTEEQVVVWRSGEDTFAIAGEEPGAGRIDGQAFDDAIEALEAVRSADSRDEG